ncbi:MAG TPA: DUF5684 domain-containing protein [Pseudobacteroides sp.]|uniref:DUF5684 domain-containing protein n=1 Tax=Pseudobacteroides sp. TaxID=1968840 RepID=UPI002F95264F
MNNEAAMAAAAGSMLLFSVIGLIVGILVIVSEWRLFEKAGEPGWACIVPIYNAIVMLKIGGNPWYWVLLMFIPVINIIIGIMALQGFLKAYGRGDIGSVLLALFFPVIYFPYLAFSKNVQYVG